MRGRNFERDVTSFKRKIWRFERTEKRFERRKDSSDHRNAICNAASRTTKHTKSHRSGGYNSDL